VNELANCEIEALRQDAEFTLARVARPNGLPAYLLVSTVLEQPAQASLLKLENAFAQRDMLHASWAARPVELLRFRGRLALAIEDPGGEFLDTRIERPLTVSEFLRLALSIAASLAGFHGEGLVHKDVKPANVIVNATTGEAWLTGFGLATRLPRHRQAADTPEIIAGTLAYMAPEQTGRMNRSIDSRSDLYSLGVTLYEMCVGELPFTATNPMEWVHCHIARLPVSPSLRRSSIPEPVSAIILKLLAKAPEERYQTAAGVAADLRRCLSNLEAHRRIEAFSLGARDVPGRLLVPERLYGREKEIERLVTAFERVVSQGTPELVLVSGYSGVGKSSVVYELHKVLAAPRGLFASGKFDQYKRDIPYATLAQAFGTLIRQVLAKSDAEVARFREYLVEALGPNGELIVNLIPELELIIGKPLPVPELPPNEAKHRFQRVLRGFIAVFAQPEHPLALFLDDLQWLDAATLELIEQLIADPELRHVLLVGAYRDNEVDSGHPLPATLQRIRAAGTRIHDIVLSPLELAALNALTADALHCHADHSRPLSELVHAKTSGNPFFAIQFLTALTDGNFITFDSATAAWKWDLARILTKGYTDNVAELMLARLNRLPETTQSSLKQLACVGNSAGIATLNLIHGETKAALHAALWEAVRLGLVFRSDDTYSFAHDRIQQAAYSLIPDAQRGDVHLRIGRVLLASMAAEELAEQLFNVASQLNRGAALLTDRDEKAQVATINLRAGRKAKASAAYSSALAYLSAGMALLDESDWANQYELTFSLWLERAEIELVSGNTENSGQLIQQLLLRAASKVDEAAVYQLKVQRHVVTGEYEQGVATALECLRQLGIAIPAHPTQEQVKAEYDSALKALNGRPIESLLDLPLMTDPELRAAMGMLSGLLAPSYAIDQRLWCLQICRMVQISVRHGTSGPGALGYVYFGVLLGGGFSRYSEGYRFAKLACDLVETHSFVAGQGTVYSAAAAVAVWTQPIADGIDLMRKGIRAAIEAGDPVFACSSMFMHIARLFVRNDPLEAVYRESELALDFVRKAKYADAADILVSQQRFIKTMQGRTATFSTFSDAEFDEAAFEARLGAGRMPLLLCWYWLLKLEARFLSGDYDEAMTAADNAKPLLETSTGQTQQLDYFYHTALTVSALFETVSPDQRQAWRGLLAVHCERLREWAENYPPTFAGKHALVSAEIARLEGRDADAMRLYEQAIRSARDHGFVQNEAVAHEVAARFYAARGFETIADAYLRNARSCYLRWGAHGKVQQLDRLYPHWGASDQQRPAISDALVVPPVGQLDAETVARATQALSSEIVLSKLIERLMRLALEHAGAERGLLILFGRREPRIEAEATTGHGRVDVLVRQADITSSDLPKSVLQYVIRTRERVIIDDAAIRNLYSGDEYLAHKKARSVLCLPIVKHAKLVGVLYLENNLTSHVFTFSRLAVLDMLASQAAISLENAALYTDLQLQVGLLQHLPASVWTLEPDGTPDFVNRVWLDFAGQTLDFVRSHPEAWMTAVHPEDRETAAKIFWEGVHSGHNFAIETRSLRARDGAYRWHLQQAVVLRDSNGKVLKFVGTTTDIDDQKRAAEALREAQSELAHVARVTTMGEFTASIAHEVRQPIAGVLINGNTCLRWLDRVEDESGNLAEVRTALQRIIRDGNRAGEIIARVQALFRKTGTAKDPLDLNETIRDIIVLAKSEIDKQRVTLRVEMSPDLPNVLGDRVQLQQVLLNLILNAIDAMATVRDRARALVIRTQSNQDRTVQVTVRDSGIGLQPESVEAAFTAFHTTKPGGLGMGLSISRSIVESHSGRLWVTEHDGPGASFHFALPTVSRVELQAGSGEGK
jgi:PAS domain S-box-containing protein